MSGAEAIVVLGVISAIISIIDGTKQVYGSAKDARGLPEAFREVAGRLPVVRNILESAKLHLGKGDAGEGSCKGAKHVVEACEIKAKKLDNLFHSAIPADGTLDLKRYYKAVKACGKGNEVEKLMKGMLEDVQLLACECGMSITTKAQEQQIVKAIAEVSAAPPSVPEHVFQESAITNNNYGLGTQYNAQGENIALGSARQYNTAGGAMHFGLTENEKDTCLMSLFITDPKDDREKLVNAKGSRVDGTCEWIKSNEQYQSWLHSHSRLLWLSGGPGKGKTMLSIFLAEELEQNMQHIPDMLVLQYFCDNKDDQRKTAVSIVRGLIYQLLKSQQKLFDHILPSFKIQRQSLFSASSFETLWRIFESMVCDPILGTTYCVLDGLDECDEDSLEVLLRKFTALFSPKTNGMSACHLSLIVVSRDIPDFIPELLSGFPRIRLDPDADTEVNDDIHRFIEEKVKDLSRRRKYPEPLQMRVKEVFRERAQGTFLWIGIVAKALERYTATEVEDALNHFPSGLAELYARMLLQIPIDRRENAAKILRWVVMAVRPLTLSELSTAIETIVRPSAIFSLDEVIRDQVLNCGYLLTIKGDVVGLLHQSVKDYLLRRIYDSIPELEFFRVKEEIANLEIARKCLEYLQNGALAAGDVDLEMNTSHCKAFPLLSYSVRHWPDHARYLSRSDDIFDLSSPFFANKKSPIRESWLRTYWAVEKDGFPPKSYTLLHLASYIGILPLAENLLSENGLIGKVKRLYDVNKTDSIRRTALMLAATYGHGAIVRLLLDNKANIEAKDKDGLTALYWAAINGHEAVVRLLLNNKANIEVKDKDGLTALHQAAKYGHEAVVRLLLDNKANIEAKDKYGWTALHRAAEYGHEAMVRLLLDNKANIEAKDKDGWTALHQAAEYGHEAMVRLLLDNKANIEAKDKDGLTALHRAAICGHEAVVRLLLDKGANIEAKDKDGWTALHQAAEYGHEAMVRLLLDNKANIEAKDKDGLTALHRAAICGHEAVVRLLLDNKANIEAKDKDGLTALYWAAINGHEAVVRLLLDKGANIEAKDDSGNTALDRAAEHKAVRLLLEDALGSAYPSHPPP